MQRTIVIDIGSNSVRKQVFSGGKIILRESITCQLSLGIKEQMLAYESIKRTFDALDELIFKEKERGGQFLAFATACVRNCKNGLKFSCDFKNRYGFELDVLSGEEEAEMGILGALSGEDGTVIDVGGASTELVTAGGGKIFFAHSMQDGAVTLTDAFLKDRQLANDYLQKIAEEFKDFCVRDRIFAIGGTANTLAFIGAGLKTYDAEKSEGYVLTIEELALRVQEFYQLTAEQIAKKFNLNQKRANVIHSGALILYKLAQFVGAKEIILTENDNLRGYYLKKVEKKSYEN